jgi:hypothetical protein
MGIDTRMPMGKAMAHIARVFAELDGCERWGGVTCYARAANVASTA